MAAVVLVLFLLVMLAKVGLEQLNFRHLRARGSAVPDGFAGAVDPDLLARTARYTADKMRVGRVETLVGAALVCGFLFGGWAQGYERAIASVTVSFVWGGVLYFLGLLWIQGLLDVPFSLYRTFRLETRNGFNRTSGRLWVTDRLKTAVIGTLLAVFACTTGLALVQWSPAYWWLWVWAFWVLLTLVLQYLSPYLIEPLFFTFRPLRSTSLARDIQQLVEKSGLRVRQVLQVDASRRSRHSNAYFTGIGAVKRVVLFDTLLAQLDPPEILAVLAHELGHWKLRHVAKRLVVTQGLGLAALFGAHRAVAWEGLPHAVGLAEAGFPTRLVILVFLASMLAFPCTPLFSAWSRRQEWQADRFAVSLIKDPAALASALVKLGTENLANLHPHPFYARVYYSHPPLVERVARLRYSCNSA